MVGQLSLIPSSPIAQSLSRLLVALLCGVRRYLRQILNPPKQELKMSVRSRWCTLRQEMSRQLCQHECKSTLRSPGSKDACPCHAIHRMIMVRHIKRLRWIFAEPLHAIPGQVLQGSKCTVGEEDKVKSSVADHNVVGMFDDTLQGSAVQAGRRRGIRLSTDERVLQTRKTELPVHV